MAHKKKPDTETGGWKAHLGKHGKAYVLGGIFLAAAGSLYMNADSRPDGHFQAPGTGNTDYSYVVKLLAEKKVTSVRFGTNGLGADGKLRETMTVYTNSGDVGTLSLTKPDDPDLYKKLDAAGASYGTDDVPVMQEPGFLSQYGSTLLVVAAIVGTAMYMARRMAPGGSAGGANGLKKSLAKLVDPKDNHTKFPDVAGADDAKSELQEMVEFLEDPAKFERLGAKIPKGILLDGPPGTGKTLLAKAMAGEANVPFYSVSGSDFVEMFVGLGAARVRDMFEEARKRAPCIIFIDEIDALGKKRSAGPSGGNDEREQTLNQLLTEMQGFIDNKVPVIVMAATNRPDILDDALLRPGRFDRKVNVGLPDINGREQILGVHMKKVPLAEDVDASVLARGTPGFSGADLANMVNEAALIAASKGAEKVVMHDFETAKDKVIMGGKARADKIAYMDQKDLLNTAWHEAAHALVGYLLPGNDPVHKISIVPHGRALGVTAYLPEKDKYSQTKRELKARIATMLAGRIGEILCNKGGSLYDDEDASTGASNDIERATQLAEAMVKNVGLSKLGWIKYGNDPQTYPKDLSEATKQAIDAEVKRIIDEAADVAWKLLTEKKDALERIAQGLMVHETIDYNDMVNLIEGGSIDRIPAKDVRAAAAEAKRLAAEEEAARLAAEEAAAQAVNDNGASAATPLQKISSSLKM